MRPSSNQVIASTSSSSNNSNGFLADFADQEDDNDCPLCLEEMDWSDLNFKPCSCGYQICQFCWHHIKENLNGRCPACRKPYTDDAVEFTPVKPEEIKKLQTAKKQRDKEKKDGDSNSRKHLTNVRVKQRTQVHVQGMTYRTANEETIPLLKSQEWFGQYGRILKLFLAKRTNMPESMAAGLESRNTPVNVYINFATTREASNCIMAIDGSTTPDGAHRIRAGWGTTKYCPAFLRGQRCQQDNCMMAHEQGDEVDPVGGAPGPVTREEMSTLKHAMKEQESRDLASQARTNVAVKTYGAPGLPASASWAKLQGAAQSFPSPPLSADVPLSNRTPPPSLSHRHSNSVTQRLPKATIHPLPARPPSREAHAAAAASAARSKHGLISGSIASTARRASTSSSSDERAALVSASTAVLMRKASLTGSSDSGRSVSSLAGSHQPKKASISLPKPSLPPGLSAAPQASGASPLAPSSISNASQPGTAAVLSSDAATSRASANTHLRPKVSDESDYDAGLPSFAPGSFAFDLNIDVSKFKGKGKAESEPMFTIDNSSSANDFLLGDVGISLASGLPGLAAATPHAFDRTFEQGYSGAFDPFAEALENEGSRPKASRFGFAKKGLFGSSDSLVNLATPARSMDYPVTGHLANGNLAHPLRSDSPSSLTNGSDTHPQSLLTPPPGLKARTDPNALWTNPVANPAVAAAFNRSPALNNLPDLPAQLRNGPALGNAASNTASLALPALSSAALRPSFTNIARQPLPSAASHPLPARNSLVSPPGLSKDDVYSHLSTANLALPPRSQPNHENPPPLNDPAIYMANLRGETRPPYYQIFPQQQQQNFAANYIQGSIPGIIRR